MKTMILAHKGASAYYPENTLEAFWLAANQGADGIELDVHLSRDGEIVVAHDARLERVSDGTGYISDYTLKELKRLSLGKLSDGSDCRIPALEEVFSLIEPSGLMINIELKTTEKLYPDLPEKLVNLAELCKMAGRVTYSSFNHYSLLEVKKFAPYAKIGLLYDFGLVDPWVYASYIGAGAIHPHYRVIGAFPETVANCHNCGIDVNVWTVDDPAAITLMLKRGVDGIITNRPDIAIWLRDEIYQPFRAY